MKGGGGVLLVGFCFNGGRDRNRDIEPFNGAGLAVRANLDVYALRRRLIPGVFGPVGYAGKVLLYAGGGFAAADGFGGTGATAFSFRRLPVRENQ